jgi:DUF971 family protein
MARHDVLNIEVDRTSHVEIAFEDGVTARFELAPLRLACPCAECNSRRQKGEPASKWVMEGDPISITGAELAGAWGLSIDWSDGHSTGIYAWTVLRQWIDERDDEVTTAPADRKVFGKPVDGPIRRTE